MSDLVTGLTYSAYALAGLIGTYFIVREGKYYAITDSNPRRQKIKRETWLDASNPFSEKGRMYRRAMRNITPAERERIRGEKESLTAAAATAAAATAAAATANATAVNTIREGGKGHRKTTRKNNKK
jgi:hypothetical protein